MKTGFWLTAMEPSGPADRDSSSATYQEIQKWVREHHGFVPKTCWIAHCKEIHGLPLGAAPNRQAEERAERCPPDTIPAITQALRHFGLLS